MPFLTIRTTFESLCGDRTALHAAEPSSFSAECLRLEHHDVNSSCPVAIKENFSFWRGDDDAGTTTGQLVASRALKYYRSYSPLHEHLRKIILQQGKLPATCPSSLGWRGELAPEPAHSSPGRQGVG